MAKNRRPQRHTTTRRQTEYKDMQSLHRVMMRLKGARNKIKHAKQPHTTIRCRSMTCKSLNTVCQEREAKWVQMFLKNKMTTDQLRTQKTTNATDDENRCKAATKRQPQNDKRFKTAAKIQNSL